MKLRAPEYYKNFQCIANKCNDTCCKQWEIDIDYKTTLFYQNIDGEFGKMLKENISSTLPNHFILDKNNKCPFLTKNNLCSIYIKLGEENLCEICKKHPRYYEWFKDFKECGVGLCCEEAARIILSQDRPFKTYEINISPEPYDSYNEKLYSFLSKIRDTIILYLEDKSVPFNVKLFNILCYSEILQKRIDNNDFDCLKNLDYIPIFSRNTTKTDLKNIIYFYSKLEPLNKEWIEYLKKSTSKIDKYSYTFTSFKTNINVYLQNLAIYFIWRYFLKGVFDKDILSKINFMVVSLIVINFLFWCKYTEKNNLLFDDCVNIVKDYSKEIEYCENNLNSLFNASYENYFFSIDYLKGLLL